MSSSSFKLGALVALTVAAALSPATAQQWPTRTVTAISMFSAGNANDIVARIVLDQAFRQMNASWVLENRPGAGGTIGVNAVAKAEPDGYTLLLNSSTLSSQLVLHKSLPYDPVKDFAPISLFGIQPSVLVTTPAKGFKSVADIVNAAKAKPGALNFASAGIGAASHMAAEKFRLAAKIDVQHIPFRGPQEAFTQLLAGNIDYYYLPIAPALANIKAGKLVALAVSTPQRAPQLPDVPTIIEAGYPDATYLFWGGVVAPAKTPKAVIDRLHGEIQKALATPSVVENLAKQGVQPKPMSVQEFTKFCHDDIAATLQLAKAINLTPTN
ncbi:MAG TPA: tripartite tricarboxylate transporter substrate-binding protein [Xanthobacteraceae bacterium]|nr:tripartite tricarboxylate transporter substrate-binding protein [Xanthobacteraceae bacterium]